MPLFSHRQKSGFLTMRLTYLIMQVCATPKFSHICTCINMITESLYVYKSHHENSCFWFFFFCFFVFFYIIYMKIKAQKSITVTLFFGCVASAIPLCSQFKFQTIVGGCKTRFSLNIMWEPDFSQPCTYELLFDKNT